MSWAPAAGVMKRECCVLAPDLRGHGLTSSTDTGTEGGTRQGDGGDYNDDGEGDAGGGDSGADGSRDGASALMSLESLAEDVTSLLVEIFTRGLLSQRPRQRLDQSPPHDQQHPLHAAPHPSISPKKPPTADSRKPPASSSSINSNQGNDPTSSGRAVAVEADPPASHEKTNDGDSCGGGSPSNKSSGGYHASHAPGARDSSPVALPPAEILPVDPIRLLLVGHSLGGSIAVRVAGAAEELKRRCNGAAEVAGLVAVDVVEGTALAALDDMPQVSAGACLRVNIVISVESASTMEESKRPCELERA